MPLLNSVLPLDLPQNELTAQLTGQLRADNTHKFLLRLLQEAAHNAPLLLLLEDAHWFDSASWSLTRLILRHVQPLLLLITTRVRADRNMPLPADYHQLLESENTQHLLLSPLQPEESLKLVCQSQ